MSIEKCDVLALKLTYILLRYYKYNFIIVKEDKNNIWLTNPDNDHYSLIRISNKTSGESFFKQESISKIKKSVSAFLGNDVNLLEIYTDEEVSEYIEKDNDLIWSTNINEEVPELLFMVYPLFVGAFAEVSDYEEEYNNLEEAISNWQSSQKTSRTRQRRFPLITWSVAFICIFIYLVSFLLTRMFDDPVAVAVVLGAYYKAFVVGMNQYWRFLSSGFVHVEWWHLMVNLFSLQNLGSYLEPLLGRVKYLCVLLAAIIMGNLLVFICSGNTVSLGLSGGLYGAMAALFVYYFRSGLIKNRSLRNNVIMIMTINIVVSLSPGISALGHAGGFIAGLFLGIILLCDDQKMLRINTIIAGIVLVLVTSYLAVSNQDLDFIYRLTDANIIKIYDRLGLSSYGTKVKDKMTEFYGGK